MTTPTEALAMARDALETYPLNDSYWRLKCKPAIAAIDTLAAQPVPDAPAACAITPR
jgi:hypothetical protein